MKVEPSEFIEQDTFLLNTIPLIFDRMASPSEDFDLESDHYLMNKFKSSRAKKGVVITKMQRAAFEKVGSAREYRQTSPDITQMTLGQEAKLEALGLIKTFSREGLGPQGTYYAKIDGKENLNANPGSIYFGLSGFTVTAMGFIFFQRVSS